jgi:release factor glutamine methyltransferase
MQLESGSELLKVLDLMREVSSRLKEGGVSEYAREAEIIITESTGLSRSEIYTHNPTVSRESIERVNEIVKRRLTGEPLQYITGRVDFLGEEYLVGPGVLIPRPETEMLVEELLAIVEKTGIRSPYVLDLGTGSGCIAISIALRLPNAEVTGIDSSREALKYARLNAERLGVENLSFLEGDLYEPAGDRKFDIIVSNPPYVRTAEIPGLQREVAGFEPPVALDGGADGLDLIRKIILGGRNHLKKEGQLFIEIGLGQAVPVRELGLEAGYRHLRTVSDLDGIERVVVFTGSH